MRKFYRLNTNNERLYSEIVKTTVHKKLAVFYEVHKEILCRISEFHMCSKDREKFGLTRFQI